MITRILICSAILGLLLSAHLGWWPHEPEPREAVTMLGPGDVYTVDAKIRCYYVKHGGRWIRVCK